MKPAQNEAELVGRLREAFRGAEKRVKPLLLPGWSGARLLALGLSALRRSDWRKASRVSPESFVDALCESATLGVEPDDESGYLELRTSKSDLVYCNFELTYRGVVARCCNANPLLQDVLGFAVLDGDEFDYSEGSGGGFFHRRRRDLSDDRPVIAAYARADYVYGEPRYRVLDQHELKRREEMSRNRSDYSPRKVWPQEMAAVSAVKALCRGLPQAAFRSLDPELPLRRPEEKTPPAEGASATTPAGGAGAPTPPPERKGGII